VKLILVLLALSSSTFAQTGTLRGQVTDESGALVPAAKVTLTAADGSVKTTEADSRGAYIFAEIPAGDYSAIASAPQLSMLQPAAISIRSGSQTLNLQLKVAATTQQVTVKENAGPTVSTEASNSASALVLRGSDLDALSDDPEDLLADLQALAGPSGLQRR
jgi:hypothetical protein